MSTRVKDQISENKEIATKKLSQQISVGWTLV